MGTYQMAWRNVWRNRRRSLVTIAAMTLALLVLLLHSALIEGYLRDMEKSVLDMEVGDLQIHAPGYRDKPSIYTRIPDAPALLARLAAAGLKATPRLLGAGLAAGQETSAGALLTGIDVARDARVSRIGERVAEGQWLDPSEPRGVVVGRRLARTLNLQQGGEVVILAQAADGSMANEVYRVRGILRGVTDAADRAGVFLNAATFRELMVVPQGAHQIIVRRPDRMTPATAAATVRAAAAGDAGTRPSPATGGEPGGARVAADGAGSAAAALDVKTWRQLLPTVASMIDSVRSRILIMYFVIYLAIGIVILNAMLMAVFERIRELGVLKALGFGPWRVLRLVLCESGIQTGLALVVGLALAVPGLWYLTTHGLDLGKVGGFSISGIVMDPIWRAWVTPEAVVRPIVTLLVIVTLAVAYPAIKAARLRPVEAIRHR